MTDKPVIRISVRNLVEFILRSGDLRGRSDALSDPEAMLLGARIHKKLQKAAGPSYRSEVTLLYEKEYDDLVIRLEGRADGIFREEDRTVIDEIKGIFRNLDDLEEPLAVHLAQARCYAVMLSHEKEESVTEIRMTYVNLESEAVRYFRESFTPEENETWFHWLLDEYHKWESFRLEQMRKRNASMAALDFPFPYREGQRKLVASVYHTIKEKKKLFIEAPTGVGKTMSVVFPSVRALGQGLSDRVFYMTARTVTRRVAREAVELLTAKGLVMKTILMTAKEKLCPMHEMTCDPEACPRAKGHFDRVNEAVFALLHEKDLLDAEALAAAAQRFQVCPFEMGLDCALWCDFLIGDYNYVYDPKVRLKRFFAEGAKSHTILLCDEAHNLPDRAREMFGAVLVREDVMAAARLMKNRDPSLAKRIRKLSNALLKLRQTNGDKWKMLDSTGGIELILQRLQGPLREYLEEGPDPEVYGPLSEFYFSVCDMLSAADRLDENFRIYTEIDEEDRFLLHYACENPGPFLEEVSERSDGTVFFSATLWPLAHYRSLLSTARDDYAVYAETPFRNDQRALLIGRDVSTLYTRRGEETYRKIAAYIRETVRAHKGNYLAFFPSYKLLEDVFAIYRSEFDSPEVNWVVQSRYMGEEDREIFLENFYDDPAHSLVGFCVMGGIFSEGIDLTGRRLEGAVIVGTGLPQTGAEREIRREYYNAAGLDGFGYAYRIPGMNKVLQAAGRVIRTTEDRGVILLLDDRFLRHEYRELFPREWEDSRVVTLEEVGEALTLFWRGSSS